MHHEKKQLIRLIFHGNPLYLDGRGCIYWPQKKSLIISDLHLGKARAFDQHGFNLPDYEADETLAKLQTLLAEYQPTRLILLGDSFHTTSSWDELSIKQKNKLSSITQAIPECIWILGNHDPNIPRSLVGLRKQQLSYENIILTHDYLVEQRPQIIGHFHPKTKVSLGRKTIRCSCFIQTKNTLILPAFGSFTGGLDIESSDFKNMFQPQETYLCFKNKIWFNPQ